MYKNCERIPKNVLTKKNVHNNIHYLQVSFKSDQEQERINPTEIKDFKENKQVVVSALTQIQSKHKGKTIDVWWLTEDGGLTVLLPQIIAQRQQWSNCKLRVFTMKVRQKKNLNLYKFLVSFKTIKKTRIRE